MARETLTQIKTERDALKKELDGFKKLVVDTTMDYDGGCRSGKEDFLNSLGLLKTEPFSFEVTFKVDVKDYSEIHGISKETIIDEWVQRTCDDLWYSLSIYSAENDYEEVEFDTEFEIKESKEVK